MSARDLKMSFSIFNAFVTEKQCLKCQLPGGLCVCVCVHNYGFYRAKQQLSGVQIYIVKFCVTKQTSPSLDASGRPPPST